MNHRFSSSIALACLASAAALTAATAVPAQEPGMLNPPHVLVITREAVKPGKGGAMHEAAEAAFVRAIKKGKGANYVAATSVTGPSVAYFLTGYDSFAAWQKDSDSLDKAVGAELDQAAVKDGELLTESRTMAAVFRSDLSYHAQRPIKGIRYLSIATFRVRPGHVDHFIEARRKAVEAHEKANMSDSYSTWQVVTGAPGGTFIILSRLDSLAGVDEFEKIHGKPYEDALGEDGQKLMQSFDREGLISFEADLAAYNPKMSDPWKEWIDADPGFWAPKAMSAKPAAAKPKAAAKKGAAQ